MPTCGHPYLTSGPFNQTNFLGCSVSNFNLSLGWGAEASSLTVKLVKDYRKHWSDDSHWQKWLNQLNNLSSKTTYPTNAFNDASLKKIDQHWSLHRNMLLKEYQKWHQNSSVGIRKIDYTDITNIYQRDDGKFYYKSHGTSVKKIKGSDLGFIGDANGWDGQYDIDIMGNMARFKFAGTATGAAVDYTGIVKGWQYNDGTYSVQLGSPAPILKGCNLILRKYHGSVSTLIPSTNYLFGQSSSPIAANGGDIAVPYNDVLIPTDDTYYLYNPNAWTGDIALGNIPNLFNIYGYLENEFGFGSSLVDPELGIPANVIYDTLLHFLSPKFYPLPIDFSTAPQNKTSRNQHQFNPYGAIVCRSPFQRVSANSLLLNTSVENFTIGSQTVSLEDLGLARTITASDGQYRSLWALDLSNVPRPPAGAYINQDSMTILDFIDYCCDNAGVDFTVEAYTHSAGIFSGTIHIATVSRRVQPVPNTIKNFIGNAFNTKENPATNRTDVSYITDYSYGEEFNDEKTRTVIIGGPQQRLHQFTTDTYSSISRASKIFDPVLSTFVGSRTLNIANLRNGSNLNTMRQPDYHSQRPYHTRWIGGSVTAQVQTTSDWQTKTTATANGQTIRQASYMPLEKPSLAPPPNPPEPQAYPIWKDLISPYFGQDTYGNIRLVYADTRTKQLQIICSFIDILAYFPTSYTAPLQSNFGATDAWLGMYHPLLLEGHYTSSGGVGGSVGGGTFTVTETELRYAQGGLDAEGKQADPYDSWVSYLTERAVRNYPTATTRIIYDYITRAYGSGLARATFRYGPQYFEKMEYAAFVDMMTGCGYHVPYYMYMGRRYNTFDPDETMAFVHAISNIFKGIHGFLKGMADTYYGKSYAVRVPSAAWTTTAGGKTRYSFEYAQDGAYEELGNIIDDTMTIGSAAAQIFQDEQGKIGPILGFTNNAEYTSQKLWHEGNFLFDPVTFEEKRINLLRSQRGEGWYFPLQHNLPSDSCITLPYTSYYNANLPDWVGSTNIADQYPSNVFTAFGYPLHDTAKWKLYVKASASAENPSNTSNPHLIFIGGYPRMVLNTPSAVTVDSAGVGVPFLEEFFAYALLGDDEGSNDHTDRINNHLAKYTNLLQSTLSQLEMSAMGPAEPYGEMAAAPKAAMPTFAAIPIKNNLMTYGPWASHPGIIGTNIFPGVNNNGIDARAEVNNLVGGVNVIVDDNLVPWEFGGIHALDNVALLKAGENNNFQQTLEKGSISLMGVMLNNSNVGSRLLNGDHAPILSSVSVNIGDDSLSTKYEMKTFTRKLGFYNKQQADLIQRVSRQLTINQMMMSRALRALYQKQLSLIRPNSIKNLM